MPDIAPDRRRRLMLNSALGGRRPGPAVVAELGARHIAVSWVDNQGESDSLTAKIM